MSQGWDEGDKVSIEKELMEVGRVAEGDRGGEGILQCIVRTMIVLNYMICSVICKLCQFYVAVRRGYVVHIHPSSLSFTSPVTDLTYPIHTHATCSSSNLIYLLTCTQCDSFYVGETRNGLSARMNGQQSRRLAPSSGNPHQISPSPF